MGSSRRSLEEVLLAAQRAGTLGRRPISEVIEHARHFVRAIPSDARSVIDIGSGAGIPGLVVASDLPDVRVTMVDRRATRMDSLTRAVESMGMGTRVRVFTADAEDLGKTPEFAEQFDVAVCRGLGTPPYTAAVARPFLARDGALIVSEPPETGISRWPSDVLTQWGLSRPERRGSVVVLHVDGDF